MPLLSPWVTKPATKPLFGSHRNETGKGVIHLLATALLICACSIVHAQNIIVTIAGSDIAGYQDGAASDALFFRPYSMCFNKLGELLICDVQGHRVRKFDIQHSAISTIAGIGVAGYSVPTGPATTAMLNAPQGIAVDADDNIYIADGAGARIRKVDAAGTISNFAGTGVEGYGGDGFSAVNAKIHDPVGLCVFGSDLYIADYSNNVVRKVNITNGIITTVAGDGTSGNSGYGVPATDAQLDGPIAVACDKVGNLYIAEQWNNIVRKVDRTTGIISLFVGNGALEFSGDNGPARYAGMHEPAGLDFDSEGNLYIADYRNGRIRKVAVDSPHIITTVAGSGEGFGGDGSQSTAPDVKLKCTDIKVDGNGILYIADYVNHRVRKVYNPTVVNGIDRALESKLYPNPMRGIFTIQTPINISLVSIYNVAGMCVYKRTCTTTETDIDLTTEPPGVYMVYVQCGEKMYASKMIKE